MDMNMMLSINYMAVFVSALVFFVIGSVWYSPLLMSNLWVEELKRHNVTIHAPTASSLRNKMLLTFGMNVLASFAMAYLVALTNATTWQAGLMLGKIVSLGFAVTSVAGVFIWESRSFKLFLIDVGYPILGIMSSAVILAVWR
jgi:hypothetical protein